MNAPLVALTSTTKRIDGLMRVRLNEAYIDAVRAAGLTPLVLPPMDPKELAPVLDAVAGVVLTGGEDVDPAAYHAAASPKSFPPHQSRDRTELGLVELAHERRVPTLAICRGIQVVNVALGGTLVQDLASERRTTIEHDQSERRNQRVHDVEIDAGSRLREIVGESCIRVNSSHHQAVDTVAKGLRVTARAPDGVIEAAEWAGDEWWMLAVQWHPEELIHDPADWDRGIFRAFADRIRSA